MKIKINETWLDVVEHSDNHYTVNINTPEMSKYVEDWIVLIHHKYNFKKDYCKNIILSDDSGMMGWCSPGWISAYALDRSASFNITIVVDIDYCSTEIPPTFKEQMEDYQKQRFLKKLIKRIFRKWK